MADHKQGFIERWLYSTNHKDIGTLYLVFALVMFFIGGAMAMVIRAELFQPGLQLVSPEFFNQMTTTHALVMIFGAVMPAFVGLANWMIPLMIGAPDMALPRMNNWSFWIMPFAFTLLLMPLMLQVLFGIGSGGPAGGWTLYPPLSLQGGTSTAFTIFAIHLMGVSSIMGAINIIATVLNMRAPGMDLLKMPIFVWTWLITAFLLIAVMPVLAGAVTMLLTDKFFGTSFFNAAGGGDPVMFQHIFCFFGHPDRSESVQLGHHLVARFNQLRNSDAVRARFRGHVHHRRFLRPNAGYRSGRLPVPRHLFRRRALPLCAGHRRDLRDHGRRLLLAAEVDRLHVQRNPGQMALLAVDHFREPAVLPAALPGSGRHAAPRSGLQPGLR